MRFRTDPTVTITCAHCRQAKQVKCSPTQPIYCSPECRRNAGVARTKYRRRQEGRGERKPCPLPSKMRYATQQLAQREADSQPYRKLVPYLCECGDWHLTGMTEAK